MHACTVQSLLRTAEALGVQHVQRGSVLAVPVYANVKGGQLKNFQAEIQFDPQVLRAESCDQGDWQGPNAAHFC